MKELYINHKLVDLDLKQNPIAFTFAVNNLAELKDRQATFSNIFKVPATENNREIFGYADDDAFTQDEPYQVLSAKYIQNGIEIVPNGIARIVNAGKYFEVQVLAGIVGFMSLIEGKYLSDLTLPEHPWNFDVVSNTQTNVDEIIYPVIDYGALNEDQRVVNVLELRPATFNKYIIHNIITQAGYSYQGAVFEDPLFENEILPFSNDKFEHGKAYIADLRKKDLIAEIKTSRFIESTWEGNPAVQNGYGYEGEILFDEYEIENYQIVQNGLSSGGFYKADQLTFVTITIEIPRLNLEQVGSSGPPELVLYLKKNGVQWPGWAVLINQAGITEKQEISSSNTLSPGDTISLGIEMFKSKVTFESGFKLKLTNSTDVVYGQWVQLEATLPKISQKDHLKDFMQRYGLTPVVDNYQKKIYFKTFKELYANKAQAKDWTDKFVRAEQSAAFTFGNYAQLNYGKWKEDDNVPEDLGQGVFTVDNQNLKPENDAIVSQFAATESVVKLQKLNVAILRKIEEDDEKKEFKIKTQPRLLINRRQVGLGISLTDGSNSTTPATVSIPYFIETGLPSLDYNETFKEYYFELITYMLKKARRVTRYVMIDESDLAGLDHFIPIYDANRAQYYYLNQISDYIEGEPTKCEFIRM